MKNNFNRKSCNIFIIFLFIIALVTTISCQKNDLKNKNSNNSVKEKENSEKIQNNIVENSKAENADQICYDLDIAFIDSSNTKAILKANCAKIYLDSNKTLLENGVKVRFFSAKGTQTGTLTAENIEIDDLTKNMFATGNVVVISDSSRTKLETQELEWHQERKKILSNVYVKITSPNEIIEGIGLESDEKLNNYRIFKVSGIKN
jgi:LPS export ABC transporter protein LptC